MDATDELCRLHPVPATGQCPLCKATVCDHCAHQGKTCPFCHSATIGPVAHGPLHRDHDCPNHPGIQATETCAKCMQAFCPACMHEESGECRPCLAADLLDGSFDAELGRKDPGHPALRRQPVALQASSPASGASWGRGLMGNFGTRGRGFRRVRNWPMFLLAMPLVVVSMPPKGQASPYDPAKLPFAGLSMLLLVVGQLGGIIPLPKRAFYAGMGAILAILYAVFFHNGWL